MGRGSRGTRTCNIAGRAGGEQERATDRSTSQPGPGGGASSTKPLRRPRGVPAVRPNWRHQTWNVFRDTPRASQKLACEPSQRSKSAIRARHSASAEPVAPQSSAGAPPGPCRRPRWHPFRRSRWRPRPATAPSPGRTRRKSRGGASPRTCSATRPAPRRPTSASSGRGATPWSPWSARASGSSSTSHAVRPSPAKWAVLWDGFGLVVKRVEAVSGSDPAELRLISSTRVKSRPVEKRLRCQ